MAAENSITVKWSGGERTFDSSAPVRIGRDASSDVVVDNPAVSRIHAELRYGAAGWVLTDSGSSQGIHNHGTRLSSIPIDSRSEIVLGLPASGERMELSVEPTSRPPGNGLRTAVPGALATVLPEQPSSPGGRLRSEPLAGATVIVDETMNVECAGQSYTFQPGRDVVFGRDAKCDVVSPNPTVSRRHAVLRWDEKGWRLEDLDSSSGVFVDGRRISTVPVAGSMSAWLGAEESGERVVLVAAGKRSMSATQRLERATRGGRGVLVIGAIAVVAVLAAGVALLSGRSGGGPGNDELARASVFIGAGDVSGSGTIIDAQKGLILTNAHVVAPRAPGQALAHDEVESNLRENPAEIVIGVAPSLNHSAELRFLARVVAVDGYVDVAVVQINKLANGSLLSDGDLDGLTALGLGDSGAVRPGDHVRIVGYPGISESQAPNLSSGVVSSAVQDERLAARDAMLNVDAAISPGNSGGMAVDDKGRLIGIPTSINVDVSSGSKANRVRPVNFAKPLIEAARAGKPYASPFVTPLAGEKVEVVKAVVPAQSSGFSLNTCTGTERAPRPGDNFLAVMFTYEGFTEGKHQDLRLDLSTTNGAIGRIATTAVYPFEFHGKGCGSATMALLHALAPGPYELQVFVGPNYQLTPQKITVTVAD